MSFLTKRFTFSSLHENAGAQLKAEIRLLPPTLRNYQGGDGVEWPNMSNAADSLDESYAGPGGENGGESGEISAENQSSARIPSMDSHATTDPSGRLRPDSGTENVVNSLASSDSARIDSVLDSVQVVAPPA
jgi:hypothetical protein